MVQELNRLMGAKLLQAKHDLHCTLSRINILGCPLLPHAISFKCFLAMWAFDEIAFHSKVLALCC